MSNKKTFDVLMIVEPYEYYGRLDQKENSLRELADLCREKQIPVRVPYGNRLPRISFSEFHGKQEQDYWIKDYFTDCDYKPTLEFEELLGMALDNQLRVLLTGGLFQYAPPNYLRSVLASESKLNRNNILNLDFSDESREIVIPYGCVSTKARTMHQELSKAGINPIIAIDGRSTVGRHQMDLNSVYLVTKVSGFSSLETYSITRRSSRKDFIPESREITARRLSHAAELRGIICSQWGDFAGL